MEKPLLTICIPTYNRIEALENLIKTILSSEIENIEVLVLDNCSDDGTLDNLYKIKDKRLSIHTNERNIGGIQNIYRVLMLGRGLYSILLLDKDRLVIEYLKDFLMLLETHPEIDFGYCKLTYSDKLPVMNIYKAGMDAIRHFGYKLQHPSGYFYKTDIYKNLDLLNEILATDKFGFDIELINAEFAVKGEGMVVNLPLVDSIAERVEMGESLGPSRTFTNPGQMAFFLPHNRVTQHRRYLTHLYTLPLSSHDKFLLTKKLFQQGLASVTFGYKSLMKYKRLLAHYSVDYINITLLKLIKLDLYFCGCFLSFKIPVSIITKIYICLSAQIVGIFKAFKWILKKIKKKLVINDK
jgi:glycosyltransferase involved in cell wall biosynthesis